MKALKILDQLTNLRESLQARALNIAALMEAGSLSDDGQVVDLTESINEHKELIGQVNGVDLAIEIVKGVGND